MNDEPTDPGGHDPCFEADDVLALVMRRELAPILAELEQLRADLGLTNGQTRSIVHRVTDLESRVSDLEDE